MAKCFGSPKNVCGDSALDSPNGARYRCPLHARCRCPLRARCRRDRSFSDKMGPDETPQNSQESHLQGASLRGEGASVRGNLGFALNLRSPTWICAIWRLGHVQWTRWQSNSCKKTSIAADRVLQYDVSVDSKESLWNQHGAKKFHAAPGSLTRTPIEHLHMETRRCGEGQDNAMHVCFGSFTVPKQVLACHKSRQHELGGSNEY